MTQVPLPGEQSALRGFRWQYDHIAKLVYDAIVDADFDKLVLASTDAGQVDDLLLFLNGRRIALQYKGGVSRATVTFNELVKPGKTVSGNPADSLWRSLARAWQLLEPSDGRSLTVHLAMAAVASTSDHVTDDGAARLSPDHLRAFLARALEPLTSGSKELHDLPEWSVPLHRLKQESQLADHEFSKFLRSVRLDLGLRDALDGSDGTRSADLQHLSNSLWREVSKVSGPLELGRDEVLSLANWKHRKSFRSVHEFPIDRATHTPLVGAVDLLNQRLEEAQSGYIAVTGPPGAGKSTLLSQTLSSLSDRVVRYYAFVPGSGGNARNRLSAEWFLHDLSTMLRDAGLHARQKQLTALTIQELRQSVLEQLDAAGGEHAETGRRTIIVVDGLDHVQRDYSGNDALTSELPKPADLPVGVIVLVGSRDLSPLGSEARQFIEDRQTEVNLESQRLTKAAVIEVCRRIEATQHLHPDVHAVIADRSAGHPLSLVYILARMDDYSGEHPEEFVKSLPQYDGDIAMQYRAAWDALDATGEVERVLRICSRLRVGFDLDWVRSWTSDSTVRLFRTQLRYLFRVERKRWRFFHDSFRQFARERTSIGDDRTPDSGVDRRAHAEVAAICESSDDQSMEAQALFHRYQANELEAVLALGTQERFRTQFHALRSASEIAGDAKLLMMAAAKSADFPALFRGLLILSEVGDKASEIQDVDACKVLHRSGLVELAIDYVGDEQSLRVPLAHAYNLAADLALETNSAGERIFGAIQHFGLEQPGNSSGTRTESDVAAGWARCAAHFLPMDTALLRMKLVLPASVGDRAWDFDRGYSAFGELLSAYIGELGLRSKLDLSPIDSLITDELGMLQTKGLADERIASLTALLTDLRFQALAANVASKNEFDERVDAWAELREALDGQPIYQTTLIYVATLEADYGTLDRALTTLKRTEYGRAMTLSELGASGDSDAIANHFEYWKLRHELEIGLGLRSASFGAGPILSLSPSPTTPAGDNISVTAPIHGDSQAIRLVERIDYYVRQVALAQALVAGGNDVDEEEAWEALSGVINLFPSLTELRSDHSLRALRAKRIELHHLCMRAFRDISFRLLSRYEQALARRIEAQPSDWAPSARVALGVELERLGLRPKWLSVGLVLFEKEVVDQGVNGALVDLVTLADAYVDLGAKDEAARICMRLWKLTLGMGSRNDAQLGTWVEWLGRVAPYLNDVRGDAIRLAQVLIAADPLTDQPIGAERLPAVLAKASPRTALSTFEYLVSHGTVSHTDAMANLLNGLLDSSKPTSETVRIAAHMTGAIIAATGNRAHPELARTLARHGDPTIIAELKSEIEKVALPTTRMTWHQALSKNSQIDADRPEVDDRYNDLETIDGKRLSRTEVIRAAVDLTSLQTLLKKEKSSSHFRWVEVIHANFSDVNLEGLAEVFAGTPHEAKVLAWAARRAFADGNIPESQKFAAGALELAPLDSWITNRDALRRRSIQILVATGAMTPKSAAEDFVRFISEERWYSQWLNSDLDDIFEAFGVDTSASDYWDVVHEYLEGLAENLSLPAPPLAAPGMKWWLSTQLPARRKSVTIEAKDAVAELLVMHLTHPAWAVREGTAQVVVSALKRGSTEVAGAMARLVQRGITDDVLESVAACLAASNRIDLADLVPIRSLIATHENFLIRRLSSPDSRDHELRIPRALSGSYELVLPAQNPSESDSLFGDSEPFLAPFEKRYRLLADLTGIDVNAILASAGRYASAALAKLPGEAEVRASLTGANMTLSHPSSQILSSRSAYGRVLGDLIDAGILGPLPAHLDRLLRSGDVGLVGRPPEQIPEVMPTPPKAGHDQTPTTWIAEIETRLDEYIAAARSGGTSHLVGAQSVLTVLNWPHLEERFSCTLVQRSADSSEPSVVVSGRMSDLWNVAHMPDGVDLESLLVTNNNFAFMERRADWLVLDPRLASRLGWKPDRRFIGGWQTASEEPAAATVSWIDGTWGRSGPMFDDTVAEGFAVICFAEALRAVQDLIGPLDLIFTLTRSDQKMTVPGKTLTRRVEL